MNLPSKPGRKPYEVTPKAKADVRRWSAMKLSKEQIAAKLGVSFNTLIKYHKDDLEIGRAALVERAAAVVESIMERGEEEKVRLDAAKFVLNSEPEWGAKRTAEVNVNVEVEHKGGAIDQLAVLLGKRPAKMIEAEDIIDAEFMDEEGPTPLDTDDESV